EYHVYLLEASETRRTNTIRHCSPNSLSLDKCRSRARAIFRTETASARNNGDCVGNAQPRSSSTFSSVAQNHFSRARSSARASTSLSFRAKPRNLLLFLKTD